MFKVDFKHKEDIYLYADIVNKKHFELVNMFMKVNVVILDKSPRQIPTTLEQSPCYSGNVALMYWQVEIVCNAILRWKNIKFM